MRHWRLSAAGYAIRGYRHLAALSGGASATALDARAFSDATALERAVYDFTRLHWGSTTRVTTAWPTGMPSGMSSTSAQTLDVRGRSTLEVLAFAARRALGQRVCSAMRTPLLGVPCIQSLQFPLRYRSCA